MGISKSKIEREIKLKALKQKYYDYVKSLDLKPLQEYIDVGLKARVFTDMRTLKPLTAKEDFLEKNYKN